MTISPTANRLPVLIRCFRLLKIGGSMALKLISNLLLIPLALYYLLADWNRLSLWF